MLVAGDVFTNRERLVSGMNIMGFVWEGAGVFTKMFLASVLRYHISGIFMQISKIRLEPGCTNPGPQVAVANIPFYSGV